MIGKCYFIVFDQTQPLKHHCLSNSQSDWLITQQKYLGNHLRAVFKCGKFTFTTGNCTLLHNFFGSIDKLNFHLKKPYVLLLKICGY